MIFVSKQWNSDVVRFESSVSNVTKLLSRLHRKGQTKLHLGEHYPEKTI